MPKLERENSFVADTLAARAEQILPYLSAPVERISSGWPLLDAALSEPGVAGGGFVIPSVVVIGAQPKAGKSIWAQHVVQSLVQQGAWCLYWDMENGAKRFVRRLGWRLSRLASAEHSRGLTPAEQKRHKKAENWIRNRGRQFCYKSAKAGVTPDNVLNWLDDAADVVDGPFIMVVDSLQKLPAIKGADRRTSIDTWLQFFETARNDYQCVFLLISELPREAYAKKRSQGGAPPFKESGDVEYSCDLGMTFAPVSKAEPRSAYLDIWWDRDGARDVARIAKYTRVLPYYEMIEEPIRQLPKPIDKEE